MPMVLELGAMASCTKNMMKTTNSLGKSDVKGATNYCFIFGRLFVSKRLGEYVMYFGTKIIGVVKTNTKGFCKYAIKNITND